VALPPHGAARPLLPSLAHAPPPSSPRGAASTCGGGVRRSVSSALLSGEPYGSAPPPSAPAQPRRATAASPLEGDAQRCTAHSGSCACASSGGDAPAEYLRRFGAGVAPSPSRIAARSAAARAAEEE
jgi:hypothetical protein